MIKNKSSLRFNNKAKYPTHRLPFFRKAKRGELRANFWSVPESGEYSGGCATGESLALIYFKYLRERGMFTGGILQHVAMDMLGCDQFSISKSRWGQIVGFFSQIESILALASNTIHAKKTEDDLLTLANKGLCGYNQKIDLHAREMEAKKEINNAS